MCGSRTQKRGAGRKMEARCIGDHLKVNMLLQSWISIIGITYHIYIYVQDRVFNKLQNNCPQKHFSIFDDVWWFFITCDTKHVASMSSSSWILRTWWHIHAYDISIYKYILYIDIHNIFNMFYLSLAVMWAHWKTPAHGSEVLRLKDSVWKVKGKHTWRNCVHGRTSGQPGAELLAPWTYFMIVKAMEDKDRARSGAGSFGVGPRSGVSNQIKGLGG